MGEKYHVCEICNKRKKGEHQFIRTPHGQYVCLECMDKEEEKLMKKGSVTLSLRLVEGEWQAVGLGTRRYPLEKRGGAEGLAVLNNPSFLDEKGNRWSGRTYLSSGTGFFQKTGRPRAPRATAAGAARKARPAARRRRGS